MTVNNISNKINLNNAGYIFNDVYSVIVVNVFVIIERSSIENATTNATNLRLVCDTNIPVSNILNTTNAIEVNRTAFDIDA